MQPPQWGSVLRRQWNRHDSARRSWSSKSLRVCHKSSSSSRSSEWHSYRLVIGDLDPPSSSVLPAPLLAQVIQTGPIQSEYREKHPPTWGVAIGSELARHPSSALRNWTHGESVSAQPRFWLPRMAAMVGDRKWCCCYVSEKSTSLSAALQPRFTLGVFYTHRLTLYQVQVHHGILIALSLKTPPHPLFLTMLFVQTQLFSSCQ